MQTPAKKPSTADDNPFPEDVSAKAAADAKAAGTDIVVLDIPLLFETGGERNVDAVVVVTAPAAMQRERVLARPGMSEAKLDAILAAQMADEEKRVRAHYVVDTGAGMEAARTQVLGILAALRAGGEAAH